MQTARLIVKRGPTLHREFSLTSAETTLGRGTVNTIVLADQEVSRQHARILFDATGYIFEDFGSTNGSFVNGRRISGRVHLQNGDEIALGEAVILQFESVGTATILEEPLFDATAVAPVNINPEPETLQPNPQPAQSRPSDDAAWENLGQPDVSNGPSTRSRLLGCGCVFFILIFLCMSSVFFLDAYQGGRLLYCGPIRPFFEIIFGSIGFAPICP